MPGSGGRWSIVLSPCCAQRVFGLALGYEDVNDHAALRHDLALQTAAERDCALASPSTLSRFENAAGRDWAWNIHEVLVEDFIASHSEAPEELILDFDATDDAVHGRQVGRFFHGYYDHYCFLPLYVFCGERLLVSYLRPSKIDGAKHAWAILALLVKRLRQAWPGVRIVLRGDSGFCRHKMLSWCERQGVGYIVGLAKNARLNDLAAPWMETAAQGFAGTGFKQRLFGEFAYAAGTWNAERRVIARIEHGPKGANPRYIVTNLEGDAQDLYEKLYCARGDMENRIKEQQLDLFRRPHLVPQVVAQPIPPVALQPRLCAGRDHPASRAGRHRDGPRPGRHHPSQALEDRRRHRAQHAARALPTLQRLPGQGPVHAGCRPARPRIAVKKRVQSRPESRRRAFQHRRSPENRPCPPKRPRRPAGARRPRPTPPTAAPRRRFTPSHNRKSASLPLHEISALERHERDA